MSISRYEFMSLEIHRSGISRYICAGLVTVMSLLSFTVNLLAIVILCRGKCGLSKCITRYMLAMAASDLLVGITDPFLRKTILIYFPYSFLNITPVCTTVEFLVFATTAVSVWLTVAFTFDRFVAICCEKLKIKYCTERTAAVVIGAVIVLGCLENIPRCFTMVPGYEFDNLPWECFTKPNFYTSSAWIAYGVTHRVLTPCLPFFLILLLNVLTVRRIVAASRVRRVLRGRSNGENDKDPEMENRRKSIVLLFSITATFILLWATQAVFFIFKGIAKIDDDGTPTGYYYITGITSTFLQLLSTCTNTCIYVVTQSKFRQVLMNAVKFPLRVIRALVRS
ncbi:putative G-protein coupled receptor 139 [Rhinoraja longicauda]